MKQVLTQEIKFKIENDGTCSINFGLNEEQLISFLNDGRIIGRLGEFMYANKVGGSRTDNEGSSYDVNGKNGERIEVRSVTHGISFASSKEVGFGRHVTENGYIEKLNSLDSYVAIDFRNIKELKFIEITKTDLVDMNEKGLLRKNKSVGSNKFYKYLESQSIQSELVK